MALDNNTCAPDIDPCDPNIFAVPSQYIGTTVEAEIMVHAENLACHSNMGRICGLFDCDTAEGETLTVLGNLAGWPRVHCNVKAQPFFGLECPTDPAPFNSGCNEASVVGLCDGAYFFCALSEREDYEFTDDDLYRRFIKAKNIKNRAIRLGEAPDVGLITEIIQELWGEDAWVVNAGGGKIDVSAGRDLTDDEQCLVTLYGRVICAGPAIEIRVHCDAPDKPIGC